MPGSQGRNQNIGFFPVPLLPLRWVGMRAFIDLHPQLAFTCAAIFLFGIMGVSMIHAGVMWSREIRQWKEYRSKREHERLYGSSSAAAKR
jgi:hypothetical protein